MRKLLLCLFLCTAIIGPVRAYPGSDSDASVPDEKVAIYRSVLLDQYICAQDSGNCSAPTYILENVTRWTDSTSASPTFTAEEQACVKDLSLEPVKDTIHHHFPKTLVDGTIFSLVDEKKAHDLRQQCEFYIVEFSEILLDQSNRHAMLRFNARSTSGVVVLEHTQKGWRIDEAMSSRCTGNPIIADYAGCPKR